jgi:hypothetical protein
MTKRRGRGEGSIYKRKDGFRGPSGTAQAHALATRMEGYS